MRTLVIDNYDSFTYNLNDLLHRVNGRAPDIVTNDAHWSDIDLKSYDSIVVSPGPGRPQRERDLGISARAIEQREVPVLGICLGHQGITHLGGGRVHHAPKPMHGRVSDVHHESVNLFAGLPSPFQAVRYHSLAVSDLPAALEPLAWTADGVMMAVRHRRFPQWGVQFHPESVLTAYGAELLYNFRRLVEARNVRGADARARRRPRPERIRYQTEKREFDLHPNAQRLFLDLYASSESAFWLDSSRHGLESSRFTIMGDGSGPLAERLSYSVTDQTWQIKRNGQNTTVQADFFSYLNEQLTNRRVEHPAGLPIDFNLGYVGALGYELKAETGGRAHHASSQPDAQLIFADRAIVIDHQQRCTYLLGLADQQSPGTVRERQAWFDRVSALLEQSSNTPVYAAGSVDASATSAHSSTGSEHAPAKPPRFRFDQPQSSYLKSIEACLNAITDGESYEICLTNTAESTPLEKPLDAYLRLRTVSEVPFGAYLRMGSTTILSASPERFLAISKDGRVEAKPIKGTRPRGATAEEDDWLKRDLETNRKDRAENLMIVDLLRNDLNRVCTVGSVHVPKLFDVESYAQVHQLVSTVAGRLAPNRSVTDCVRATFPGGSMTGAPKVRTMEIIDGLEHRARGYYSGAVGWISLCGAADLSIVIRTLVNSPESCTFGVGGAIVSLSDPDEEYTETLVKSRAMLSALNATLEED